MSLATASSGEPDAKKFRFSLPQAGGKQPFYDMNQNGNDNSNSVNEKLQSNESGSATETADSSFSSQNSPSASVEIKVENNQNLAKDQPASEDVPDSLLKNPFLAIFEQTASDFIKSYQQDNLISSNVQNNVPSLTTPPLQSHQTVQSVIPGALAVAASPAAQLFDEDDWSWHRNPAAAIRSGGTNKSTPVWKYFVYNKAENLSRCIIGDCTYLLKGPHTSTLACHLKKHPAEYAEFQRLKVDYTRERNLGNISNNGSVSGSQRNGRSSSAASNGSNSSMNSTPNGCNIKQGSSNNQTPHSSPATNQIKSASVPIKKQADQQQTPLNSIFAVNPLLTSPGIGRQPILNAIKNPNTMNELLNNLNARAAAASLVSQQAPSSSSNNSPISTPTMISSPLHFMNLLKQNNGIFGPNNANFEQKNQQIVCKKWARSERKQREMETKLALMMCSLQIPSHRLNDPFLRDFLETAQPKFQLPSSGEPIDQTLIQLHSKALANIKASLANIIKFTLMVNAIKPSGINSDGFVYLSISIAYYSQSERKVETVLLGVRRLSSSELNEKTFLTVSQVLSSYELSMNQVTKTLLEGFERADFPNQLQSYRCQLVEIMEKIVDKSELYNEIRDAIIKMVNSFCGHPEALMRLSRLCGMITVTNLQQLPFEKLAQLLLEIREPFLAVCCQQATDQFVHMISESQWAVLDNILRLKRTFKAHMEIVQENAYATIDRVVPSISQLLVTLEKDFPLLDNLPLQLSKEIQQKLSYILDPQADNFDSTFVQATALNPQLVVLLDEHQLNCAKQQIEKSLCDRIKSVEESINKRSNWKANGLDSILAAVVERKSNAIASNGHSNGNEDENSKSTSSLYPDLVQAANQRRKQIQERNQSGKNHYAEAMIQAYFDDALNNSSFPTLFGNTTNVPCQPFQFWQMSAVKCAQLSELAIELLSIPSSIIPPEYILNPPIEGGPSLILDEHAIQRPFEFIRSAQSLETLERDAITLFNRSFWQKSQFF